LWTPGYWGWNQGAYVWYPGYWGDHVGYYGGVNYGYGYMGVGFAGGMWRGNAFVYNSAVMRVDDRYVHNTYEDRTIVERTTIVNNGHVAFSGGPGGINHQPMPEEQVAAHENHVGATSFQASHESSAMSDRSSYATQNGGHPQTLASPRPMNQGGQPNPRGAYQSEPGAKAGAVGGYQGVYQGGGNQNNGSQESKTYNASHSNTGNAPAPPTSQPNNGNQEGRTYNSSHSNTGNAPVPPPQPQGQPKSAPQKNPPPKPNPKDKDHQH
jgi:hypothetical protein